MQRRNVVKFTSISSNLIKVQLKQLKISIKLGIKKVLKSPLYNTSSKNSVAVDFLLKMRRVVVVLYPLITTSEGFGGDKSMEDCSRALQIK